MNTKQTLTLEYIRNDLRYIARINRSRASPILETLGGIFGILTVFWFILFPTLPLPGIALGAFAIFFIVRYIKDARPCYADAKALRCALTCADISIDVEAFSHTARETIIEPHSYTGHANLTKYIPVVYFLSGASWRIPFVSGRLYKWSKTHSLSLEGLENISLEGDEFYYVSLQGHPNVSFIYPCKFFVLAKELEGSATQKAQ